MSQLLAPTHTLADSIPLGRRINEIMLEKGSAYTISAMAKRLEINRETLRLMLKGEREIYTFELEKIAKDLHVTVERILQSDVVEDSKRI
ncbi:MAG: helix-turn-helix domain-containing protein, partial [Tumebacillaceae bacterium]